MRKQPLHPVTEFLNKTQKNQSKQLRVNALSWLAQRFPLAFDNTTRIRPLKTGIMNDLLCFAKEAEQQGISKSKLREAVVVFTRRLDYLACLKSREMRIDLDGNPTVSVSEDEALQAAQKIKKRVEKGTRNAKKPVGDDFMDMASFTHRTAHKDTQSKPTAVIKHKTTKQYDPSAVARLREKLGLVKSNDEKIEQAY